MEELLKKIIQELEGVVQRVRTDEKTPKDSYEAVIMLSRKYANIFDTEATKNTIEEKRKTLKNTSEIQEKKIISQDIRGDEISTNLDQMGYFLRENPKQFNLLLLVNMLDNLAHFNDSKKFAWYNLKNLALQRLVKTFGKDKVFIQKSDKMDIGLAVFFELEINGEKKYLSWHTLEKTFPDMENYNNIGMYDRLKNKIIEECKKKSSLQKDIEAEAKGEINQVLIDKYLALKNNITVNKILTMINGGKIKPKDIFPSKKRGELTHKGSEKAVKSPEIPKLENNGEGIKEKRPKRTKRKYPDPLEAEAVFIDLLASFNLADTDDKDTLDIIEEKIKKNDFSAINKIENIQPEIVSLLEALNGEVKNNANRLQRVVCLIFAINELIRDNNKRGVKSETDYSLLKEYSNKLIEYIKDKGTILELKKNKHQVGMLIDMVSDKNPVKLDLYFNGDSRLQRNVKIFQTKKSDIDSKEYLSILDLVDLFSVPEKQKGLGFEGGGSYASEVPVKEVEKPKEPEISAESIHEFLSDEETKKRLNGILNNISPDKKAWFAGLVLKCLSPEEVVMALGLAFGDNSGVGSKPARRGTGRPKGSRNNPKGGEEKC